MSTGIGAVTANPVAAISPVFGAVSYAHGGVAQASSGPRGLRGLAPAAEGQAGSDSARAGQAAQGDLLELSVRADRRLREARNALPDIARGTASRTAGIRDTAVGPLWHRARTAYESISASGVMTTALAPAGTGISIFV